MKAGEIRLEPAPQRFRSTGGAPVDGACGDKEGDMNRRFARRAGSCLGRRSPGMQAGTRCVAVTDITRHRRRIWS